MSGQPSTAATTQPNSANGVTTPPTATATNQNGKRSRDVDNDEDRGDEASKKPRVAGAASVPLVSGRAKAKANMVPFGHPSRDISEIYKRRPHMSKKDKSPVRSLGDPVRNSDRVAPANSPEPESERLRH